ncbi:MAG: Kiwa anti-phage protein KwaB-like domain-containing protein [Oscillospiraceae bacterium]
MSKDFLLEQIKALVPNEYSIELYFLKIDKRNQNPYFVFKHTFKNSNYLPDYINALRDTIIKYQIQPIEYVQKYDGQNSKTSCDKLSVNSQLISEQWNHLFSSVAGALREQITGKYQGYLLNCQPQKDGLPSITIVKTGNPLISLAKKDSKVFRHTALDELEDLTDELCRLYLVADFIVIGETMYAFNQKFEGIFRIEKTLHRLKMQAVEQIMDTAAFVNAEKVQTFMSRYTSPKTFLTLRVQRVEKLKSFSGRVEIAELLGLKTDKAKIIIDDQEQANQLIKYLCYKILQDKETDNLIEVSSVINEDVLHK